MEQNQDRWVHSYVYNCYRLISDDVELTASNGNDTYGFAVRKIGQHFFVGVAYILNDDKLILEGTIRDSSMNHSFRFLDIGPEEIQLLLDQEPKLGLEGLTQDLANGLKKLFEKLKNDYGKALDTSSDNPSIRS